MISLYSALRKKIEAFNSSNAEASALQGLKKVFHITTGRPPNAYSGTTDHERFRYRKTGFASIENHRK